MRVRPIADMAESQYDPQAIPCTITIATDTKKSAGVDLQGLHLFAVQTPAALTSTSLTFEISTDGGLTYTPLYDQTGALYTLTVAPSRVVPVNPYDFAGFRYLKVVGGSAELADRVFNLIARVI